MTEKIGNFEHGFIPHNPNPVGERKECKCTVYPEGIDMEGCPIHENEVYKIRRENQALREQVERLKAQAGAEHDMIVTQFNKQFQSLREENAAINECHEGDSKYITKLRDTIKELGEYLKKIITYGSPHNKDWDCIDVAKEALSNPIVKQVMEKVYPKEDV